MMMFIHQYIVSGFVSIKQLCMIFQVKNILINDESEDHLLLNLETTLQNSSNVKPSFEEVLKVMWVECKSSKRSSSFRFSLRCFEMVLNSSKSIIPFSSLSIRANILLIPSLVLTSPTFDATISINYSRLIGLFLSFRAPIKLRTQGLLLSKPSSSITLLIQAASMVPELSSSKTLKVSTSSSQSSGARRSFHEVGTGLVVLPEGVGALAVLWAAVTFDLLIISGWNQQFLIQDQFMLDIKHSAEQKINLLLGEIRQFANRKIKDELGGEINSTSLRSTEMILSISMLILFINCKTSIIESSSSPVISNQLLVCPIIIINKNTQQNIKPNNLMETSSFKQNIAVMRPESREMIFHFCEKYAKKADRRIKTEPQQTQMRSVKASKIHFCAKGKHVLEERKIDDNQKRKMSNFQILKRKITYLESEEILGDKSQRDMSKILENNPEAQYIVNGEFSYSKKVTILEKYRQSIKKKSQKRKLSHNLLVKAPDSTSYTNLMASFYPPTKSRIQFECQLPVKKRETATHCAKRYFRPNCFNKNLKESGQWQNVKGIKIQQLKRDNYLSGYNNFCIS